MSNVRSSGPKRGLKAGSRRIDDAAALDRAVERLGDDARADAGQLAAVELRLAQDVEPQRGPLEERLALLGAVRSARLAPPSPSRSCASVSGVTATPLLCRKATISWPEASLHHRRAREVAEREVRDDRVGGELRLVEASRAAARRAG